MSSEFEEIMDNATTVGPASDGMIQAVEEKLSLTFPIEYKSFLKKYGAAMGAGFEIAGIFVDDDPGPPMWRDVLKVTERFRKSVAGNLPDSLIAISDDGSGIAYYIDASHQGQSGCPVIAYGPDVDGTTVAESFEQFVLKMSRDEITV